MIFDPYLILCIGINQKIGHRLQEKSKGEKLHDLGIAENFLVHTKENSERKAGKVAQCIKHLEEFGSLEPT